MSDGCKTKCSVTGRNQALVATCHLPQIHFFRLLPFFVQFDILVSNYSEIGLFVENETILCTEYYSKQIELKNSLNHINFQILTSVFSVQ